MKNFFFGVLLGTSLSLIFIVFGRNEPDPIGRSVSPKLQENQTITSLAKTHDPVSRAPRQKRRRTPPKEIKISLSRWEVESLEHSLQLLEEQSKIHKTPHGWKLASLSPESTLYRMGFRESDEIPRESIKVIFSADEELFYRFSDVMDTLAR